MTTQLERVSTGRVIIPERSRNPQPAAGPRRIAMTRVWRRVPFTATTVSAMLLLALVTGSLWRTAAEQSWFTTVGYGLAPLTAGHWWTPVTGVFFAVSPIFYLPMVGSFALLVGFAEWRLGTRRTAVITIGGQLAATAVAVLGLLAFRDAGWGWSANVSLATDAGFSAGALAMAAAGSSVLRAPWRLRVRAALVVYVLMSFVLIGTLADLLHLIAVALVMPLGPRLVGQKHASLNGRPSRREWRLLAVVGLALIAVSDVVLFVAPADGPLGPTGDEDLTLLGITVNLLLVLVLANGLHRGRRSAWWVAVIVAGLSTSAGVLLLPTQLVVAWTTDTGLDLDGTPTFVAGQLSWLALFVVLLLGRNAFRAPSRRRLRRNLGRNLGHSTNRQTAVDILRRSGGSNLSWMTTWPENEYFVTADNRSVVAYQVHGGVAIGVGDPVGPRSERVSAIDEFAQDSERLGLVPVVFSATATTTEALGTNWRTLQIAEDTILDLASLQFKGRSWQDIRTALNRAAKEHISFRLVTLADEPWSVVAQLRAISEQWVGDKGLPEMGFTLGGVDEALDREVRVGLAQDASGRVHGVVSWLPVHTGDGRIDGWTLDVMRRRDGGFRPVIEFLIAQSALAFQAEGARFVSLSGAPLARADGSEISGLPRVLDVLGGLLEPVYGFRSLHTFKAKFQPRYESMHLIYRDEADLPRIGLALARAYLPDTSMRDLVRVARTAH